MEVFAVKSKGIKRVGYDFNKHILLVVFVGRNPYLYKDIPDYVYYNLMNSDCKEAYFNSIKNNYEYTKIK